jgi:sec-independent protein translocase protein TatA
MQAYNTLTMGILLEGFFFSPTELLLILGVCLLMFGGKKIPEVMKGLGSGIKNFKDAIKDEEIETPPAKTPGTPIPGVTSENLAKGKSSESSEPKKTAEK